MTKPLYKNTGKYCWERSLFNKLFVSLTIAEDPSEKWWKRRWCSTDKYGVVSSRVMSVEYCKTEDNLSAYFIYVLMLQFALARV